MIVEAFNQAGLFAKLGMLVSLAPLGAAILYAISPTERRLATMRPLSLAAIFGALTSFVVGAVNILQGIGVSGGSPIGWNNIALGAAESLVPLFIGFSVLTISWLCVAVGMRRTT